MHALAYTVYLSLSLFVTLGVGHRLHRAGCPFLADLFPGRLDVGRAINDALLTGYYLVNIALGVLLLRRPEQLPDLIATADWVCGRLGIVLLILGTLHIMNVLVLLGFHAWLLRRRSLHS